MNADVTLYHNPKCSTSRNALALLQSRGLVPRVVEYLKTPLTQAQLLELGAALGDVRALLRTKEALCQTLGLDAPETTDAQVVAAIAEHPVLFNRPVVQTEQGAWVARPAEVVLTVPV